MSTRKTSPPAPWSCPGLVGEGSGTAFLAYMNSMDLIDPAQALAHPQSVDWSARPDLIYALIMAMLSLTVTDGSAKAWEQCMAAFVVCANAGRPDVPIPGVISLMNRMPDGARLSGEAHRLFSRFTATLRASGIAA